MDVDMEDAADDDARVRDDDDGGEDMMEVDAELVAMTLHELRCARAAIDGLSSPEDRGSCMPSNGDILPPPRSAFDRDDDDAGAAGAIVVVVPDTNVLVRHGGASVRMLRERFRSVGALAARVVVPRKVIEELDGLKASSDDGGRRAEVAALARSVNRAIASALEENERATANAAEYDRTINPLFVVGDVLEKADQKMILTMVRGSCREPPSPKSRRSPRARARAPPPPASSSGLTRRLALAPAARSSPRRACSPSWTRRASACATSSRCCT